MGSDIADAESRPVAGELREHLLEPFVTATRAALIEMAGTEVVVRAVNRKPPQQTAVTAVVGLAATAERFLVLSFPKETAAAFAGRILAGVAPEVDERLVRDCVGEIANVIAGQAKALLAGTSYRFTFSLPMVVAHGPADWPPQDLDCLVVAFGSDLGDFNLQLLRKP
jgi:chemotaxis protein CheX